jgi:hypothetical protein
MLAAAGHACAPDPPAVITSRGNKNNPQASGAFERVVAGGLKGCPA